ncbi:serine/threonine-protein kinase Nek10 isoform X4 [Lingula anatina]|uniref:Serine/threonine-protein kinase Nek10 isoform X4 n=1 Tax=Lingula anatina TaxID=7574 RepID=A0A1S3I8R1_LINAN|nr:serine/threonine-protein kinase Nek10 isoform X4 [Lingula anatina]|eukprot:XP_013394650.1 serine/threonine-protein kinase Nek10 isoform X4 [Lingula anatina]
MPAQEKRTQQTQDPEQEAKELCRLLSLINTPASKQQLPSIDFEGANSCQSLQWPVPQPRGGAHQHQSTEALALEQFSMRYQNERHYNKHPQHKYFSETFSALVKQRLMNNEWSGHAPPENILRVLMCLRIMMRDGTYQKVFFDLGAVKVLSERLQKATDSYLTYGDGPFVVDILKEMTNIFQKLSAVVEQREWLVACSAHKPLVLLLSANDVVVLHCSLHALISLSQSPGPRSMIGQLNIIEVLHRILQDYDILSKQLAANLLRILCADPQVREMVKVYDGVPLYLSLLHSDNIKLLWNVVWCLVQLAEHPDTSDDIRMMGGIPLIISLLQDRKFVSDRTSVSTGLASAAVHGRTPHVVQMTIEEGDEMREQQLSLQAACCAALTELVLTDTNAQQIVQHNCIYLLGLLILPQQAAERDSKAVETLQKNAFRTLRFLFSVERNRRLFKRMFPPELFEMFIDIGHYVRDISAYKPLVDKLNGLPAEQIDEIRENILQTNKDKTPNKFVGEYALIEHLGSGAFGSVYKVKKKTAGQSFLALKEVNLQNQMFGRSSKEKDKSVGEIISELTIIKEQLKHPNVVRYYKTFVEEEKLYIVMEYIEGAPIGDHFISLKEKGARFEEARIWHIFIQLVLALRYLHKDRHIVHRDLSPNNILLGEGDQVTITDFGLAKQKQKDASKMTSVVGTILYACPEIVQHQPYGEKADVWAIGCILYQMCTLNAPFYNTSMLSLAKAIVEASYAPLPEGLYSEKVSKTIKCCLTADPSQRPDIVQVAGVIAEEILQHLDLIKANQISLEKKLERERKRTQKHFVEANKNMQNYHRLFLANQERYDKLVNLAGSGGATSIKDGDLADSVFSDGETFENMRRVMRTRKPRGVSQSSDEQNGHGIEKGWASDDDSYQSSGSDSRDSSTGSLALAGLQQMVKSEDKTFAVPRPPGTPRGSQGGPRRKLDHLAQQLSLDIPGNTAVGKSSRDSGISSSEPSPNNSSPPSATCSIDKPEKMADKLDKNRHETFHRSVSTPEGNSHRRIHSNSAGKMRPSSATNTATLTISPRKVRQISDPILQVLHILHKIIYITQVGTYILYKIIYITQVGTYILYKIIYITQVGTYILYKIIYITQVGTYILYKIIYITQVGTYILYKIIYITQVGTYILYKIIYITQVGTYILYKIIYITQVGTYILYKIIYITQVGTYILYKIIYITQVGTYILYKIIYITQVGTYILYKIIYITQVGTYILYKIIYITQVGTYILYKIIYITQVGTYILHKIIYITQVGTYILHKIIYITQLPPTLCHNPRRRIIERFKRAMFAPQSTSFNLKSELKKLLIGSQEVIDLNFGPSDMSMLSKQASLEQDAVTTNTEKPAITHTLEHHDSEGITYEKLHTIIESVLVESGYYDMSPNAHQRRMPLGPIGGSDSFRRTPSIIE